MLKGKVRFVRLNCDLYQYVCSKASIRGYPTLKLYAFDNDRKHLKNGIKLKSTTATQIRDEVLEILSKKLLQKGHDEL